jgi:hypothetical protein
MVGNKIRVYVALYFGNFITSESRLVQEYGSAAYHWGIYLETKDQKSAHVFDVKDEDAYINQGIPGGWTFHSIYDVRRSRAMLCKVMISKLPPTVDSRGVGNMLSKILLPVRDTTPVQNCVT